MAAGDDQTRRERFVHRPDWNEEMIAEASVDARVLRQAVYRKVDTGLLSPKEIVAQILA